MRWMFGPLLAICSLHASAIDDAVTRSLVQRKVPAAGIAVFQAASISKTNGGRGDGVIPDIMRALRAEYGWPD